MEIVVYNYLPVVLKDIEGICKCEDCIDDIAALALNKLPPHYIKTEKGEMYSKLDEMQAQFRVDVIAAIMEAVRIVSNNPSHNSSNKMFVN